MATIHTTKEIGLRLKQLRQQTGISQERLAEMISVSTQQLQKYESGVNMMNTEKLQRVANALSVPVQAIFASSEEYLPMNVFEQQLLDSFRAISNKRLQESCLEIVIKVSE